MAIELTTADFATITDIRNTLSAASFTDALEKITEKIIYVSTGNNATDNRGALNPYDIATPFASLSAAVDAASSGDTINLFPGTYIIGSTINLPADVNLIGTGSVTISGIPGIVDTLIEINTNSFHKIENITFNNANGPNMGVNLRINGSEYKIIQTIDINNCNFFGKIDCIFALQYEGTVNMYFCNFTSTWDCYVTMDSVPDITATHNIYNCTFLSTGNTIGQNPSRCIYVPGANVNIYNTSIISLSAYSSLQPTESIKVSNTDGGTPVLRLYNCYVKTGVTVNTSRPIFIENGGYLMLNGCTLINESDNYTIDSDTSLNAYIMSSLGNADINTDNITPIGSGLTVDSGVL